MQEGTDARGDGSFCHFKKQITRKNSYHEMTERTVPSCIQRFSDIALEGLALGRCLTLIITLAPRQ